MHLGFYVDEWREGGVPAFINRALDGLTCNRDAATLFLARPHPKREPPARDAYQKLRQRLGAHCISLDLPSYPERWRQAHFVETILHSDIKALFVSQYSPVIPALRELSRHLPVIGISHNDLSYYYEEYKSAEAFLDANIAVSKTIRDKCLALASSERRERIHTIPYGVRTQDRPLEMPSGDLRVVYCARLDPKQKRVLDLPPLWKSFLRQNGRGHLSIIGTGSAEKELQEALAPEVASGSVTFYGQLEEENVYRLMAGGDVILNISNFEGLPQTVLEGASLGLWPLLSRIESGHSEIIERLGFGTLCPVGNNNAFIQELLRLGSELNSLRARRALIRERTLRHFSLAACLSRYRKLAGTLSRGRISGPPFAPYRPDLGERLARPFLLAKYLRHMH